MRKEMCKKFYKNTLNFQNFVRLCQKHENSACFTSFPLKSQNFAQILENFAQACVFMSSAFRSSVGILLLFCMAVTTASFMRVSLSMRKDHLVTQLTRAHLNTSEHVLVSTKDSFWQRWQSWKWPDLSQKCKVERI